MNKVSNRPILFFAAIGLCAVIYSAWQHYRQQQAENAARAILSSPMRNPFDQHSPPPKLP